MSKYLEFKEKGNLIFVLNKKSKDTLGEIYYYKKWNQYVFNPYADTIFNNDCMMDILMRITGMNQVLKNKK